MYNFDNNFNLVSINIIRNNSIAENRLRLNIFNIQEYLGNIYLLTDVLETFILWQVSIHLDQINDESSFRYTCVFHFDRKIKTIYTKNAERTISFPNIV